MSILDVPQQVGSFERALQVTLLPHADAGARLLEPEVLSSNERLRCLSAST